MAEEQAVTGATFVECVHNAKRVLEFAEQETDLLRMERLEKLGDSWTALAHVIMTALSE